jgi:hypothetical protein
MRTLRLEQLQIREFLDIADEFLTHVVGHPEALITDRSQLCDFTGCGPPKEVNFECDTYNDYCDKWDRWMCEELRRRYGIEIESTRITLVDLFNRIRLAKGPTIH